MSKVEVTHAPSVSAVRKAVSATTRAAQSANDAHRELVMTLAAHRAADVSVRAIKAALATADPDGLLGFKDAYVQVLPLLVQGMELSGAPVAMFGHGGLASQVKKAATAVKQDKVAALMSESKSWAEFVELVEVETPVKAAKPNDDKAAKDDKVSDPSEVLAKFGTWIDTLDPLGLSEHVRGQLASIAKRAAALSAGRKVKG